MKYYLGYYHNQKYNAIKSAIIGDSILSVVDYTTNFPTIKAIKEELFREGLIPSLQTRIDYVIEKNKKNGDYRRLTVTDKIYTSESKEFFDIISIKEHLDEEINNLEFFFFLNAKYLNKYGYTKRIYTYLYYADEKTIEAIFKALISIAENPDIINIMTNTLGYLKRNAGCVRREILEGHIESFGKVFTNNDYDVSNFYVYLKKYVKFRQIPAMSYLSQLLQLAIRSNRTGQENVTDSPDEYINRSSVMTDFLNAIIYDYDYEKKEFKTENGKRKIKAREMFDLAVFIEEYFQKIYEEYLAILHAELESPKPVYEYDDDQDEKEEFLTDEDFKRVGATAAEMGYKTLR